MATLTSPAERVPCLPERLTGLEVLERIKQLQTVGSDIEEDDDSDLDGENNVLESDYAPALSDSSSSDSEADDFYARIVQPAAVAEESGEEMEVEGEGDDETFLDTFLRPWNNSFAHFPVLIMILSLYAVCMAIVTFASVGKKIRFCTL